MQPSNALQQMLKSPHLVPDPGNAKYIAVDRDRLYCSLSNSSAGSETRVLRAPPGLGLVAHLGCALCASGSVVVTVQNSAAATTGTITFTGAGQWIGLSSFELSAGVYSWQATDVYGCTTTIQTAGNWSAAVAEGTMTNLVILTGLTAPAIAAGTVVLASNITALTGVFKSIDCSTGMSCLTGVFKSLDCSTGMTANALTAGSAVVSTNLTVRSLLSASSLTGAAGNITALTALGVVNTNLTVASNLALCGATLNSGGASNCSATASAFSSLPACAAPVNLISASHSSNNLFRLPAALIGLACNVVNIGASTIGLVGNTSNVSFASAASTALATANATGSAINLVCDGTNWWHRVV